MRCRICGNSIDVNTGICKECEGQEEVLEKVDKKNSKKELFSIKRKYIIKYELLKYWPVYFVFLCSGAMLGTSGKMAICMLFMVITVLFLLFINKRIAKATSCKFYSDRIEYKFKFLFINVNRVINYKELSAQPMKSEKEGIQRFFNIGNLYFYKKGLIDVLTLRMKNVVDFEENVEKIDEILSKKVKKNRG